jgi:hypothetical protein
MDNTLIYYIASVLDPRCKTLWIEKQHVAGRTVVLKVKDYINEVYKTIDIQQQTKPKSNSTSVHIRMLQALHKDKQPVSDIDYYSKSPVVE